MINNKTKIYFKGLNSCLQRKFSIDQYRDLFEKCGFEILDAPGNADNIFIWTCAFREDYRDNSIRVVKDYVSLYGMDRIIVCGCLPSIDEELLRINYNGAYFKWKDDKNYLEKFIKSKSDFNMLPLKTIAEINYTCDIVEYKRENPDKNISYYDQFIKAYISEGCLYDCTYCSEKLAFPKFKSYPLNDIVAECSKLIEQSSTNKIALVADSIGNYGSDIGSSLDKLISAILAIDDEIAIGLMNLHPSDFINYEDYLINLISQNKLFLLSVPIQSASDKILELMNRPYRRAQLERIFSKLGEYNFKELETHVIVGFPSEGIEEFMVTVDFLLKYKPKYVMASSYMESKLMNSAKFRDKIESIEINKKDKYFKRLYEKREYHL